VVITDTDGGDVYQSPDFDCPGALNCTSTSFTIPAGILSAGKRYQASITVIKALVHSQINSSTISGSDLSSTTELFLNTTGGGIGPVVPFTVSTLTVDGVGLNTFEIQPAVPQRTYVLQFRATLNDATPWTQVGSVVASGTVVNLNHTAVGNSGYYRVVGK
jgi:hypothetical protein